VAPLDCQWPGAQSSRIVEGLLQPEAHIRWRCSNARTFTVCKVKGLAAKGKYLGSKVKTLGSRSQ